MKFTYFKKTGEFCRNGEWDGDCGYEFDYEPSEDKLKKELKTIIVNRYGLNAWELVKDTELYEEVALYFIEELHDAFIDDAMESEEP